MDILILTLTSVLTSVVTLLVIYWWSKAKTKEIVELIKSFEFNIPQGQTTRYFKLTDEDFEK